MIKKIKKNKIRMIKQMKQTFQKKTNIIDMLNF